MKEIRNAFFIMYQYMTVRAFLNDKSILKQSSNPISEESGLLCDFTDGSIYKNNQLFIQNVNTLKLILYQDSF